MPSTCSSPCSSPCLVSSLGTQEFYQLRADVTKRLIAEAGCKAVCLESDWPETSALHAYAMLYTASDDVDDALNPFLNRFPVWMWRNHVRQSARRATVHNNDTCALPSAPGCARIPRLAARPQRNLAARRALRGIRPRPVLAAALKCVR